MPFYDYKCESCENIMENQLRKYEEKFILCDKCEGQAEQQFSGKFVAHGLPNGHNAVRVKRPK